MINLIRLTKGNKRLTTLQVFVRFFLKKNIMDGNIAIEHQGCILKRLTKEKRITQENFAKLMGISRSSVKIYYKEAVLKDQLIDKAIEVLNVDRSVFFQKIEPKIHNEEASMILKENEYLKKITGMQEREILRLEDELKHYKGAKGNSQVG